MAKEIKCKYCEAVKREDAGWIRLELGGKEIEACKQHIDNAFREVRK